MTTNFGKQLLTFLMIAYFIGTAADLKAQEENFKHYDGRVELIPYFSIGQSQTSYEGAFFDEIESDGSLAVNLGVDLEIYLVRDYLSLYSSLNLGYLSGGFNAVTTSDSEEFSSELGYSISNFELISSDVDLSYGFLESWIPFGLTGRYDINDDLTIKVNFGGFLGVGFIGGIRSDYDYEGVESGSNVVGSEYRETIISSTAGFNVYTGTHFGIGVNYKLLSLTLDIRNSSSAFPILHNSYIEENEYAQLRIPTLKLGYRLFK